MSTRDADTEVGQAMPKRMWSVVTFVSPRRRIVNAGNASAVLRTAHDRTQRSPLERRFAVICLWSARFCALLVLAVTTCCGGIGMRGQAATASETPREIGSVHRQPSAHVALDQGRTTGLSLQFATPESIGSRRRWLDAALAAGQVRDADRSHAVVSFLVFRVEGELDTYTLEFCDARRPSESRVLQARLSARETDVCFAVISLATHRRWAILQLTKNEEISAVGSGPIDAASVPLGAEQFLSAGFVAQESGTYFFGPGRRWTANPADGLDYVISFNGVLTQGLARQKLNPSRPPRGMAGDVDTTLRDVPLFQWPEPVWLIRVRTVDADAYRR